MMELDFRNASVRGLFYKQLVPALLGMMASALYVVIDGIFVGQGVGSDGIAAVNINNPLMTFISALGMMFGMGGGVIASLHLAHGHKKAANRTLTQTLIATFLFTSLITLLLIFFHREMGYILGSDAYLIDNVSEYMLWYSLCFPFMVMMTVLPFFIRLSNPAVPMYALTIGAVLNVILDYLFIFVFDWGLRGAAIATDIGQIVGALIMFFYILHSTRSSSANQDTALTLVRPKFSWKIIKSTFRELRRMIVLGFSVFLSEFTVSIIGIAGNYAFMRYLGADGVAAYSIVCYILPVIFMVFNAAVQSIQPIVSYNYGCGQMLRTSQALRLALEFSVVSAIVMTALFVFAPKPIVSLFIPEVTNPAWHVAVKGLPYFAIDFIFFGINSVIIGYCMSLERITLASTYTVIRGLLPVIFFFTLPLCLGDVGLWTAVAASDVITTMVILISLALKKRTNG